jgi:DNA-directed RNA polymerase subunit RPC12/RpoP
MEECPECGNKSFIRNVKDVKDLNSKEGIYTCTNCKSKFKIEGEREGMFYENAQPKRID